MRLHNDARRSSAGWRVTAFTQHSPLPRAFSLFSGEEAADAAPRASAESALPARLHQTLADILHAMALGHLILGLAVALTGLVLVSTLRQPAIFGLAASGAILVVCGLFERWQLEQPGAFQSPVVLYCLPYADFGVVSLWLLLFGVTGPILLFFAYIILITALLLGSQQAIWLTLLAGGVVCGVSVGLALNQSPSALTLPSGVSVTIMLAMTGIALGLLAYAVWLFSLHLDFMASESARLHEDRLLQQAQNWHEQQELALEIETLNKSLSSFLAGNTQTRVPPTLEVLEPVQKNINMVLDQEARLLSAAPLVNRVQERIGILKQALQRLISGDGAAFQVLASPSKTSLDVLIPPLLHLSQQWWELRVLLQRARAEHHSLTNLTADLAMLRQSLSGSQALVSEMLVSARQSAGHLYAQLEGDTASKKKTTAVLNRERPLLREMELRARQQSAALEELLSHLNSVNERLEQIEAGLQNADAGMEQALNFPASARALPPPSERTDTAIHQAAPRPRVTGPLSPPPFPLSGQMTGPLTMPETEGSQLIH